MGAFFTWIGSSILDAIFGLFNFIINIFPQATVTSDVSDSIETIVEYMFMYEFFFPINTMFLVATSIVGFEIMFFLFRFIKWVAGKLVQLTP